MKLDKNALTAGDLWDFEEAAGVPLDQAFNGKTPSYKTLTCMLWICGRQENPAFTLEDARAIKIDDIAEIEVVGEPDPTPGGD